MRNDLTVWMIVRCKNADQTANSTEQLTEISLLVEDAIAIALLKVLGGEIQIERVIIDHDPSAEKEDET